MPNLPNIPGGRETGFLLWISKLFVFREKETRFLGVTTKTCRGEA